MAKLTQFVRPDGGGVYVNPLTVTQVIETGSDPRRGAVTRICYPGGDFVDVVGALARIAADLDQGLEPAAR